MAITTPKNGPKARSARNRPRTPTAKAQAALEEKHQIAEAEAQHHAVKEKQKKKVRLQEEAKLQEAGRADAATGQETSAATAAAHEKDELAGRRVDSLGAVAGSRPAVRNDEMEASQ